MELSTSTSRELLRELLLDADDCLSFLQDAFKVLKDRNSAYSYHMLARTGGIASASYLREVLQGKRTLTPKAFVGICSAFRFDKNTSELLRLILSLKDETFNNERISKEEIEGRIEKLKKILLVGSSVRQVQRLSPSKRLPPLAISKTVAALGNEGEGASYQEILDRTSLAPMLVREILFFLNTKGIIKFRAESATYHLPGGKVLYDSAEEESFIKNLYLEALEDHHAGAQKNFKNQEAVRMVFTFSSNPEKVKEARVRIRKVIEDISDELEDPGGRKVYNLVFGLSAT